MPSSEVTELFGGVYDLDSEPLKENGSVGATLWSRDESMQKYKLTFNNKSSHARFDFLKT